MADQDSVAARIRREPPAFRVVAVRRIESLTPYMTRVTFHGDALEGLAVDLPAASVRLLLPSSATRDLVLPEWNGNEFLLADGKRPVIRTFTPRRVDSGRFEIDLDVVIHEGGAVSAWIGSAAPGDAAAISGPGRGYAVDPDTTSFVLAGDETAIPAISQLLEAVPPAAAVSVVIEIRHLQARMELPRDGDVHVDWVQRSSADAPGEALLAAIRRTTIEPGAKVWVAGEAASLHRIRRHLFDERGLQRSNVTARGYWKHGR